MSNNRVTPKSVTINKLIEGIKEPLHSEEYMKKSYLDKFLLHMYWCKKEADDENNFSFIDKINEMERPFYKYTLFVESKYTGSKIGEYTDVKSFMKDLDLDEDEAKYLINYAHRYFKKSKYTSYHKLSIKCFVYKLKENDYVLDKIEPRLYKYF